MFDELRTKLAGAIESFITTSYPNLPVNFPNRVACDPEGRTDPFVHVYFTFSPVTQLELGSRNVKVKGSINITFFYRPGTGIKESSQFSDFLVDKFGLRTINGIVFQTVSPYYDAGMAGWEGTLNVVPFQTEYFNV